jgi:hypothetical protein
MPSLARAYGGPTQSLVSYILAGATVGIDADIVAPHASGDDVAWLRAQLPEGTGIATFAAWGGSGPGTARASRLALAADVCRTP